MGFCPKTSKPPIAIIGHWILDILHSTFYIPNSELDILNWTFYIGHSTLDILHWIFNIWYSTLDILHWIFNIGYSSLDIFHWTFYIEYSTLDILHWIFYIGHSSLDILHWIFYIEYSTLIAIVGNLLLFAVFWHWQELRTLSGLFAVKPDSVRQPADLSAFKIENLKYPISNFQRPMKSARNAFLIWNSSGQKRQSPVKIHFCFSCSLLPSMALEKSCWKPGF